MQSILQRAVLAILLSFGSLSCVGQTTNVSFRLLFTGTEVYDWRWVVGSPQYSFGLAECHWWEDSPGRVMPLNLMTNSSGQWVFKMVPEKDHAAVEHRSTEVLLGPLHFSVPLPKVAVAIIGGVIVLALVFLVLVLSKRRRNRIEDEPHEV